MKRTISSDHVSKLRLLVLDEATSALDSENEHLFLLNASGLSFQLLFSLYIYCLDDEALICVFLCTWFSCIAFISLEHLHPMRVLCIFLFIYASSGIVYIRYVLNPHNVYDSVYLSKASSLVLFVEGDANTWAMQPRSKVEAYRAASTGRVDDRQDHVCPLALVYFWFLTNLNTHPRGPRRGVLLLELKM